MGDHPPPAASEHALAEGATITPGLFPVVYSLLSPAVLVSAVLSDYALAGPVVCRLLCVGVNDTYLVSAGADRYILRIYRAGWRSLADIRYELALIRHLDRAGVAVATPVARRDGDFIRILNAPEGPRQAILFTYAPGHTPAPDATQGYRYGRTLARLHTAADDFASRHARSPIDLAALLDRPLEAIRPALEGRSAAWASLLTLTEQVRARLRALPLAGLTRGVCHGDFQWKNAHVAGDQTVTIFDFDHCGPGWRAYDLAVFRPATDPEGRDEAIWTAFLKGYTAERRVSDLDLAAVPLFGAAIRVATMGLYAAGRDTTLWGSDAMNDRFFDRELALLRAWLMRYSRDRAT